ncbi:histone chaperone ASF1A [Acrasis kona]|uniref:Histone chaperone ASF1A n=1 Tax=Acrasis kona TaxID=1008807 RepID=A0AAW2YTE3_9EUKA
MSSVMIKDVKVFSNPAPFNSPIEIEVTFECVEELKEDLEWKLVYVGSSEDDAQDQELDSIMVGPINVGTNQFTFSANPPNHESIPRDQLLDNSVIFLEGSYLNEKFVQVGYFINNEYTDPLLKENPPNPHEVDKIQRNILADQPRITTFPIDWSKGNNTQQ